jgi:hypothetical protein
MDFQTKQSSKTTTASNQGGEGSSEHVYKAINKNSCGKKRSLSVTQTIKRKKLRKVAEQVNMQMKHVATFVELDQVRSLESNDRTCCCVFFHSMSANCLCL